MQRQHSASRKSARIITRWKAASIHLSISAFIGVISGGLLFGVWYPSPLFHAAGADELILLLVGVDLCIGPLLTLLVFRQGKWGLKFDLAVIGVLQLAALIYGMHVVLEARPIFLAAVVDRIEVVAADEITDDDLAQGSEPEFRSRSWTGPRLVAVQMPKDEIERSDLAFSALNGRDAQNIPKYFRHYSEAGTTILKNAKSLDLLQAKHPEEFVQIDDWLKQSQHRRESLVWVPLEARKADQVMLVDAKTAEPVKAFAVDPW